MSAPQLEIDNLVSKVSEEIDSIIWNVYGKIERVVRTSTSSKSDLEFRYDAMGKCAWARAPAIVARVCIERVSILATPFKMV